MSFFSTSAMSSTNVNGFYGLSTGVVDGFNCFASEETRSREMSIHNNHDHSFPMMAGINVYREDHSTFGAKDNAYSPECPYLDLITAIHDVLWRRWRRRICRGPAPLGRSAGKNTKKGTIRALSARSRAVERLISRLPPVWPDARSWGPLSWRSSELGRQTLGEYLTNE